MSLDTTDYVKTYAGNGSTTVFPFAYLFYNTTDLKVTLITATGVQTLLTLDVDYSVSGAGSKDGGDVTLAVAPATGETLVIVREPSLTQDTTYRQADDFPAQAHERAMNKAYMVLQKVSGEMARTLRFGEEEGEADALPAVNARKGKMIRFNASTGAVEMVIPTVDEESLIAAVAQAEAAQTGAEAAQTGAEAAQTGAEAAQTGAEAFMIASRRDAISGLVLSNNSGDMEHDIDITSGTCLDSTRSVVISLASSITKRFDSAFTEGTGNGGFATGETLPTSGTLHIWVIAKADGTTDVFANDHGTSGLTPTLPTGFVYKRFIGSWRTDASANIIPGVWDGDLFVYTSSILDVSVSNSGTTAASRSLSVPHGYAVLAVYRGVQSKSSPSTNVIQRFSPLETSDDLPSSDSASLRASANADGITAGEFATKTNNVGQIRTRANQSNCTLSIDLIGYRFDRRKL